jgi:uncharacterized caspase-like protein
LFAALIVILPERALAAERRVALVIGNGAYAHTPLPNTINDARAMTEVLGRLGFKVITRLNATQRQMLHAIVEFGQELDKGAVGLFYYAGHAVQIRGRNFMVPIGAKIGVQEHVEPESVDMNKVIGRMAGARNKLNIVILDACRDNPFGETFNFYSEGLAQTRAPAGTYIAYAAAPGELAADGTGTNSFYTGALVRTLETQGITIEEAFKRVRAFVLKETKGLQVPWTSSSITDDFYFKPAPPRVVEKKNEATAKAVDREVVFWQSIYNSDRPEDFEAYLKQFPKGNFAALARNRLGALQRQAKPVAPKSSGDAAVVAARRSSDPALLEVIDRAMAGAKEDGADYAKQIQAAVKALNDMRRQREEVERKAAEARKQVAAAVKQKAEKKYAEDLAKAKRDAVAAEQAGLTAATEKAEAARKKALDAARARAARVAAEARARAEQVAERRVATILAEAETKAATDRKVALATANDKAADVYSKSMAEAEAAAEKMRQRMLEIARQKADKQLQETLAEAKKEVDAEATAVLAKAKQAAEAQKQKDLAAADRKIESAAARLVTAAEQDAQRKYEATLAKAKEKAEKTRQRKLAEATRAAEAARARQIASVGPDSKPGGTVPAAPSDAELGLGKEVPPALRERIDAAMTEARKKGQGRAGEMRAALQAIKAYRAEEAKRAKAGKPPPKSDAPMPLDFAAATPELKEIIEIAMKRARDEGKSYQGQVQAALNAVKVYRERESTEEISPEKDSSQTSTLLLGKAQADPELRSVIIGAMAKARARGEDYAAQVRAALAAIKAHRARTAGAQAK